jgi:hypothetical protein
MDIDLILIQRIYLMLLFYNPDMLNNLRHHIKHYIQ